MVLFIRCRDQIGVASTKNYIAQILSVYLFSMYFGRIRVIFSDDEFDRHLSEIKRLPMLIERVLGVENQIIQFVNRYAQSKSFVFIGRGLNYPTALEGALKLKEISYIHATGYPAGELKHGPIALIDDDLPVVCLAPKTATYQKMVSNIQEVKARGGRLIIIATESDTDITDFADDVIYIPEASAELTPLLSVSPLQLLSYHIALQLECDVDQPRNLAKSVTVEYKAGGTVADCIDWIYGCRQDIDRGVTC